MQYFSEDMQDEGNFENNLLIKLKKEFYLYDNPISSMEVTLASLENSPDVKNHIVVCGIHSAIKSFIAPLRARYLKEY
jgi:hypothetical protein